MNGIIKQEPLRNDQVDLIKATIARKSGRTGKVTIAKETLEYLYQELKLSSIEVAKILGVTKATVLRRMREMGIERRTTSEAVAVSTAHRSNNQPASSDHPWWRGGTKMKVGYLQVMNKEHREADRHGYVFVHRLIAEQKLGRPLESNEEVHHVNGIRTDNRPDNLEVMTKSEHMRLHANEKHANGLDNFGFRRMNHEE